MATELGSYYVSLVPTGHNISGHMQKVFAPAQGIASSAGSDAGGRFSGAFGSAVGTVGKVLAGALAAGAAAGGAAIVGMGTVGLKTAAQLETTNLAFTTMLGSADKAAGFLGEMRQFAKTTPFDLPGLSKAASSLISIGVQQDKIIPIMTTLGNVTSGMGTGSEGIKRATVALQQMNAAGRISAEDLNQLRDAGIPVFELLTAATGKSTEEIARMRDKGELGRNELNLLMDALETGRGFERFNGLMETQSKSLTGLWETLKDTFSVGMADAIEPAIPYIKSAMSGAISWLETTGVPMIQGALSSAISWITQLDFSSWSGFWTSLGVDLGGLSPILSDIGGSMQSLWPAMQEFMKAIGRVAPDLFRIGIESLANALGFLADHADTIIAWMPAIVAGFIAWKIAAMGVNYVTAASVPIMMAANVARFMAARAELQVALAHGRNAIAAGAATGATQAGMLANTRASIAAGAHRVQLLAQAGAARIAAAGQWLMNTAVMGFPLVWLVVALAAVVAGIVWFATQTEWGRSLVAGAWAGIQGAIGGVVDFWNGVVVPAAQTVFGAVGAAAVVLYEAFIRPVFDWISAQVGNFFTWFSTVLVPAWNLGVAIVGEVLRWLWTTIILPVFTAIGAFIGFVWGTIIKPILDTWVWIFQNIVGPAILWLWESVLQPAFFLMGQSVLFFWNIVSFIFRALWAIITNIVAPVIFWLWRTVFEAAWNAIVGIVQFAWGILSGIWNAIVWFITGVLGPAFDALWNMWIRPIWEAIGALIRFVWETVIAPIWNGMIGFINEKLVPPFNDFLAVVTAVWDGISLVIGATWNFVRTTFLDPMVTFFRDTIPGAFQLAKDNVGRIWDGIKGVVKEPIKWVINSVINDGIIGTFNNVADFLKIEGIPKVKLPDGWREGGHTGPGAKRTVKGPVHANEYVLRSEATNKLMSRYGLHGLDYMNKHGELPTDRNNGAGHGSIPADAAPWMFSGVSGNKTYDVGTGIWRDIAMARKLYVTDPGGMEMPSALRSWDNKSGGVQLNMGAGNPGVRSMWANNRGQGWWGLADFGRRTIEFADNTNLRSTSAAQRRAVAAHEVGHMLGLQHNNSETSIMHPTAGAGGTMVPSANDARYLAGLYPGPGQQANANGGDGGGGGGFNPFAFLFDVLTNGLKKAFPDQVNSFPFDAAVGIGKKAITDVSSKAMEMAGGAWDWLTGGGGDDKDSGNGRIADIARRALQHTGNLSRGNQSALIARIMQESSGNSKAVNMWDSNRVLGGTHGLMQLLHGTFNQYRDQGLSNNIYDDLANVVAGINYTKGRYRGRSLVDVWGQKGGYRDGGYVFDDGGWLMPGMAGINMSNSPEPVFSDTQWDILSEREDGGRGDIYVQNPFTGDYLIAEVEEHAVNATGDVMQGSLVRSRRGGKYAGMRR